MSEKRSSLSPADLSVSIEEEREEYSFGSIFRIVRAVLRYTTFSGRMSEPVVRINFERGESVGILLYDLDRDAVVLVRQFRYPVYASLEEKVKRSSPGQAWLLEIVAGVKESHLKVAQVASKELLEEAGYEVKGEPRKIATVYPSPGGTSERITIFLGLADSSSPVGTGGGVVSEGEDTQVVVLPFEEALGSLDRGEIQDAKTVLALQYLARIDRASLRTRSESS
jgi:ADP-ribose pyrophosphatase